VVSPSKPRTKRGIHYLYPQDVRVTTIDGVRVAEIDFSLPTVWDEVALKVAEKCSLSGWELARRNYEKAEREVWFKKAYPRYHQEMLELKEARKRGDFCIRKFNAAQTEKLQKQMGGLTYEELIAIPADYWGLCFQPQAD